MNGLNWKEMENLIFFKRTFQNQKIASLDFVQSTTSLQLIMLYCITSHKLHLSPILRHCEVARFNNFNQKWFSNCEKEIVKKLFNDYL